MGQEIHCPLCDSDTFTTFEYVKYILTSLTAPLHLGQIHYCHIKCRITTQTLRECSTKSLADNTRSAEALTQWRQLQTLPSSGPPGLILNGK